MINWVHNHLFFSFNDDNDENEDDNDEIDDDYESIKLDWIHMIQKLSTKYKVVTTNKVENILCTMDDNLTIKDIAAISTSVKYIIAINTGPLVGCLNTYALKNVTKWYIYDKDLGFSYPNCVMNPSFDEILIELEVI